MGFAERSVQIVRKALLKIKVQEEYSDRKSSIHHKISYILFSYQNIPNSITRKSLSELFLKRIPETRLTTPLTPIPGKQKTEKSELTTSLKASTRFGGKEIYNILGINKSESEDSWDTDQIPQVTSYHRLDLTPGRVVLVDAVTEFEKFLDNMQNVYLVGVDCEWKPTMFYLECI
ncbi:hypothetical protein QE152_g34015 [Popillia japonica]|uniref:3'-5' exonuclease domain-containing protein n=1 Tax=Popillia japonica TaxID=7064 RepID=A0AAW1IV42_POPJA